MNQNEYVLNQNDIEMLKRVYNMRCLTIKQAYELYYKDVMQLEGFIKDRLHVLEKLNYIKLTAFNGNYAISIEKKGYDFLKDTNLVREIVDADSNKAKKGYNTPKENNLQTKAINHQIHLNEFVLQFEKNLANLANETITSEYFDEKNVSKYVYMRPDGLLSVVNGKNKIDFFLEMDMATESAKQLEEKWIRYKNFINSKQFYSNNERIVVLFIIANTEKVEERRRLVLRTILEKFEGFNNRFEIFVGTKNELLERAFDLIINRPDYRFYMKDLLGNKGIKSLPLNFLTAYRNKIYCYYELNDVNYLYDDYTKSPISVLDKIQNLNMMIKDMQEKTGKAAKYLIMTNDIEKLFADIKYLKIYNLDSLVFTTPERLREKPLHEALFVMLRDSSVCHFDETFKEIIFEQNIENE